MEEVRIEAQELTYSFGDGAIRVQPIGRGIVRIERARDDGSFCDEQTFTVVKRPPVAESPEGATLRFLPNASTVDAFLDSLTFVVDGKTAWSVADDVALAARPPQPDALPRAGEVGDAWVLHDNPRVVPPKWGSLDPPDTTAPDSGWRIEEGTFDVYLFVYRRDIALLWQQVIEVTGHIPVPPLWTFGLWTSRYYPYTHTGAIDVIDRYEQLDIPLDAFVVDTDWRVGASRGYEVNTDLFPDMAAFLEECRSRQIRTVFNDHPEPKGLAPLDPALFQYRRESLTRILDMGLTAWWFDRNWRDIIQGPVPGLETAVWGQKLYYDIIRTHRPGERPVILSMTTAHPAAHRYPIWWTGDNFSDWHALSESVRDTVADGMQLRPYTAPDVGGHIGFPSPEQYVRWVQWASVCPTFRLHCGPRNRYRYPWRFGDAALSLTRDYVKFRYRLLPYLYSLAHRAEQTGKPILAGVEFAHSEAPRWARDSEFLLGEALLVSPVTEPSAGRSTESLPYRFHAPLQRRVWTADQLGTATYGTDELPDGEPAERGYDHEIRINSFNSSEKGMAWGPRYFVVWTGTFEVPANGWYRFRLVGNGRKELCLDGDRFPHVRKNFDGGTTEAVLELSAGEHSIAVSFHHLGGGLPVVELAVSEVPEAPRGVLEQAVWLPAGEWRDLYGGTVHTGPTTVLRASGIEELPVFARCGSILALAPVAKRTGTAWWRTLTFDVFPHISRGSADFTVYFDDGVSDAYLSGELGSVNVTTSRENGTIAVRIGELEFPNTPSGRNASGGGSPHGDVEVSVRVHMLPGEKLMDSEGGESGARVLKPADAKTVPLPLSDDVAAFRTGETVLFEGVSLGRTVRLTVGS